MKERSFRGKFSSLESIREVVAEAARLAGLSSESIYEVELAVTEACSNIIEHAYGGEGRGEILISCEPDPEGLTIKLKDRGASFDPKEIPDPDFSVPIEELNMRGAGLRIIRRAMDSVEYRSSKGYNTLVMRKVQRDRS